MGKSESLKKLKSLWQDDRTYLKRLLIALPVVFAAAYTFLFFGPLELTASSGDSLSFTYRDVAGILALAALAVIAVLTPLLALLRGKIFNITVSIGFFLVVAGYCQGMFFNGWTSLGILNGDAIVWSNYLMAAIGNICLWVLILVAVLLVLYFSKKIWRIVLIGVSCALVVMQAVPTVGILCGAYDTSSDPHYDSVYLSDSGMKEYGKNKNVFVYILDRLDYNCIEDVLEENPEFFGWMDGFTSYTNAVSTHARTNPALSVILSGDEEPAYLTPPEEYYSKIWHDREPGLLRVLQEEGYHPRVYTDKQSLFSQTEDFEEVLDNVRSDGRTMNVGTVIKKLCVLSAYRYGPLLAKPFFWHDSDYYNQDMYKVEENAAEGYQLNDAKYGPQLRDAVLGENENGFQFIHFLGPHPPYNLNRDGTWNPDGTNRLDQTIGSFRYLFEAFVRMKELGIYDDATIIITADHGAAYDDSKPVQYATRIGLFYKPAGASGTPLQQSSAPVSVVNIPATILKNIGQPYDGYPRPLDEIPEDDTAPRYYYKSVTDEDYREYGFYTYKIVGDASDMANWENLGLTEEGVCNFN